MRETRRIFRRVSKEPQDFRPAALGRKEWTQSRSFKLCSLLGKGRAFGQIGRDRSRCRNRIRRSRGGRASRAGRGGLDCGAASRANRFGNRGSAASRTVRNTAGIASGTSRAGNARSRNGFRNRAEKPGDNALNAANGVSENFSRSKADTGRAASRLTAGLAAGIAAGSAGGFRNRGNASRAGRNCRSAGGAGRGRNFGRRASRAFRFRVRGAGGRRGLDTAGAAGRQRARTARGQILQPPEQVARSRDADRTGRGCRSLAGRAGRSRSWCRCRVGRAGLCLRANPDERRGRNAENEHTGFHKGNTPFIAEGKSRTVSGRTTLNRSSCLSPAKNRLWNIFGL